MRGALLALYRYRAPLYVAAVLVVLAIALTSSLSLGAPLRTLRSVFAIVGVCIMGLCALLVFFGARLLPARDAVVVASPVAGRWLGMNSPATKVPSHGVRMYGQSHAIDLVFEPEGRERPGFGTGEGMRRPEEYPAFGEPVFAMISGTVVRSSDWRRDHRARSAMWSVVYMMVEGMVREIGGPGFIVGNHVTVRGEGGVYATVAHLQRGSVIVRVGDRVRAGQQIGRCGNSGNSSEPHVHAQLADRQRLLSAQGIPMAFAGIAIGDGAERSDGLPATNEQMRA